MKTLFKKQPELSSTERAHNQSFATPDVNIYETKDGYFLEAEMPGVNKDGLEITLEAHEITLTGNRAIENVPGEVLFRERHAVGYRRTFELDPAIDTTRISARMNQGVLLLTLPRAEATKPRKILVSE